MRDKQQMLEECATGERPAAEFAHGHTRFWALEPENEALVRISALVALGAPQGPCRNAIRRALEAGVSDGDVVATLIAVSTILGLARAVSAAPVIALGIGYDVDAALTP